MLNIADIRDAEKRLRLSGIVKETPLIYSTTFSKLAHNNVYLKLENLQTTGSFKIRGAYNKISQLTAKEKAKGVIASSTGNHAQGVAYSAKINNVKATIVMPEPTPLTKIIATRGYGANVILYGSVYDDAYNKARELQKKEKKVFIHPYDDEDIIAGQGTIGLEILKQLPKVDAIVVPIGGGGLISGIAIAAKSINPKVKVIGVEAQGADSMVLSLKNNKLTFIKEIKTIADGIAVKHPGKIPFSIIKRYVDKIITVDDDEIASSILDFLERAKLLAEPAGAVSLAAVIHRKIGMQKKNVVALISGGNIDIKTLDAIIKKGLIKSGRLIEFRTALADKPGELNKLLRIIAEEKVNIISVDHKRIKPQTEVGYVDVDLILETEGHKHVRQILKKLKQGGYKIELY